jgi:hypothetical protein
MKPAAKHPIAIQKAGPTGALADLSLQARVTGRRQTKPHCVAGAWLIREGCRRLNLLVASRGETWSCNWEKRAGVSHLEEEEEEEEEEEAEEEEEEEEEEMARQCNLLWPGLTKIQRA